MTNTENFGLQIPDEDDVYGIEYLKHNLPIIDKNLAAKKQNSTTVIVEDSNSIRTDYADGTYLITVISSDGNTITSELYDAENNLLEKRMTTIDGNTIEEKEVSV